PSAPDRHRASTRTSCPSAPSASISAVTNVSDSSGKRSVATRMRKQVPYGPLWRREAVELLRLGLPAGPRRQVAAGADDVQRPALHLVVDAPHVLPDDPDRDQLDPAEQEDDAEHRREPGDRLARQPKRDHDGDRAQREERQEAAEHG